MKEDDKEYSEAQKKSLQNELFSLKCSGRVPAEPSGKRSAKPEQKILQLEKIYYIFKQSNNYFSRVVTTIAEL